MENRVAKHRENPINRVAKHRGNRKHRVIIISAHSNYKTQFYEKKDIRFSPICLIKSRFNPIKIHLHKNKIRC